MIESTDAAVAVVGRLADAMTVLTDEFSVFVTKSVKDGKRVRLFIKLLAGAFAFGVLLSVAIGVLAVRAQNTSNKAAAATSAQERTKLQAVAACNASNVIREDLRTLTRLGARNRPSPAPHDPGVTAAWVEVNHFWSSVRDQLAPDLIPQDCTKIGSP